RRGVLRHRTEAGGTRRRGGRLHGRPGPVGRRGGRPAPASPGRGLRAVLDAATWALLLTCSLTAAGQAGADGAAGPLAAQEPWEELFEVWVGHDGSRGYYTWVDEQGRRITYTAIAPAVGDEYITAEIGSASWRERGE